MPNKDILDNSRTSALHKVATLSMCSFYFFPLHAFRGEKSQELYELAKYISGLYYTYGKPYVGIFGKSQLKPFNSIRKN